MPVISRKNTYVENTLRRTLETLATPEAATVLGAEAVALSAQIDSCFIPNNQSGLLSIPREYRGTDSTAIIAVRPRAKLRFGEGFNEFTPGQQTALDAITAGWDRMPGGALTPREMLQAQIGKEQNQQWALVGNKQELNCAVDVREPRKNWSVGSTLGTYATFAWANADNSSYTGIVSGRPVIFLPYSLTRLGGKDRAANPVTVGHEFVHARQRIKTPILKIDPGEVRNNTISRFRTRNELEAYHIDHKIGQVGEVLGENFGVNRFGSTLEAYRLQLAPASDPFYPAPELCQLLGFPLYPEA